ncbi:unnamed protein product [Clavelina lepadiformis]|uniref:Uncharacterized protein n=1 Tax=Clavelina lepadiformis TaxID=159417 RepID=A0ABP0FHB2_CLALP
MMHSPRSALLAIQVFTRKLEFLLITCSVEGSLGCPKILLSDDQYKEGDAVLLRDEALRQDETRKFHLPYKGPYVVKVIPPVNYLIKNRESKTCAIHFNRLKKSYGNFDRFMGNLISEGESENKREISPSTNSTNNRHSFRESCSPEPALTSTYQLRQGVYIVSESIQNPVQNNNFVSEGAFHSPNRPQRIKRRPCFSPDVER